MRLCNERQQVKNVKLFPNCTSSQQRLKPFFYFLFFLQCTMCECFMSAYAACVCHKDGWMIDFFFFLCRWTPYMNLYLGKGMESSFLNSCLTFLKFSKWTIIIKCFVGRTFQTFIVIVFCLHDVITACFLQKKKPKKKKKMQRFFNEIRLAQ